MIPIKHYTAHDLAELDAELATMPEATVMMEDYEALRDAVRVCAGVRS